MLFLRNRFCVLFSFVLFFAVSCRHSAKKKISYENERSPPLSEGIRDLKLFPINALRFRLSELENTKTIIVFMRDMGCPLSEKYGSLMAYLEEKYSKKGVLFIYNYVGQISPKENAREDLKKFGFKGPYLIDSKHTVIKALSVQTTNEVLILTPERQIIYRGPIEEKDISDIFEALLSGKKTVPKELPTSPYPGCVISRPVIKNKVFWKDVAPIIQQKCTSCHNPSGSGPIDYLSYEDVAGRKSMFKYVIENDLMPPWPAHSHVISFKDDISLTSYEKALLIRWLDTGLKKKPEGTFFPRLIRKQSANTIKNPDYVIKAPKKITIPATGFFPYQTFTIQTSFTEDKWIKKLEFIIKPKVLHHVVVEICDSNFYSTSLLCGKRKTTSQPGLYFSRYTTWALGAEKYGDFSNNVGIKIPKNAEIILEMHYEPIGEELIDDMTEVRFVFHKNPPENQHLILLLNDYRLKIPMETSNYKNETDYRLKNSLLLTGFSPHMHLRGKASSIVIKEPEGQRKNTSKRRSL